MRILLIIVFSIFLSACTAKVDSHVKVSEVMDSIKSEVYFENAIEEDMKSIDIAERHGISVEDIEEGSVYYTKSAENADKVILLKAKDEDSVEVIEHALNAEIIGLKNTWKKHDTESKKVDEHILKTRGNYVILIVSDDAEQIEKIYDEKIPIR